MERENFSPYRASFFQLTVHSNMHQVSSTARGRCVNTLEAVDLTGTCEVF